MRRRSAPLVAGIGCAERARPIGRRYHFHLPGLLYVLVTILLALGAFNSQNNLLFLSLGLAMGGLVVSGLVSGAILLGVRIGRVPPADGRVGEPLTITYEVWNANLLWPAMGLIIEETAQRAGDVAPTWGESTDRPRAHLVHIGPKERLQVDAMVVPRRRGAVSFAGLRASTTLPFGITRKSVSFAQAQHCLVRPAVIALRQGVLERLGGRHAEGSVLERLPGQGDDFYGLRDYVPGDSLRAVAWKPSARTGRLAVRQTAVRSPLRAWIVLRFVPGHHDAQDQERAICLAASILGAAPNVAMGLAVPAGGLVRPPRTGPRHISRLEHELALLDPEALSDQARRRLIPATVSRVGACLIVHAGPADRSYGPADASHFSAQNLVDLMDPRKTPGAIRSLLGLGGPEDEVASRVRGSAP